MLDAGEAAHMSAFQLDRSPGRQQQFASRTGGVPVVVQAVRTPPREVWHLHRGDGHDRETVAARCLVEGGGVVANHDI